MGKKTKQKYSSLFFGTLKKIDPIGARQFGPEASSTCMYSTVLWDCSWVEADKLYIYTSSGSNSNDGKLLFV